MNFRTLFFMSPVVLFMLFSTPLLFHMMFESMHSPSSTLPITTNDDGAPSSLSAQTQSIQYMKYQWGKTTSGGACLRIMFLRGKGHHC
jgi:hypothetical protein